MAGNKKPIRRPEEIERLHNAAAAETVAFGTTAGTMLLGILAATAEAQHDRTSQDASHNERASADEHDTAPPSSAPEPLDDDGSPTSQATEPQADSDSSHLETFAQTQTELHISSATAEQANGELVAASAVSLDTPQADADLHSSAGLEIPTPDATPPLSPQPSGDQPLTAGLDSTVSLSTSLDATLSTLSNTMTTLTGDVQHLVSTLEGVTNTLTATAANLTQSILSVPETAADTLVSTVFEGHNVATPLIDTSGPVPVSNPLAPLTIGFAGQPQPDGHDTHDGAFSALGLHHF